MAASIVFITIEDETGTTNLVVHPGIYERYRAAARHGVMLQVTGKVDRAGSVVHVVCWRIETVDGEAAGIRKGSRDFH
ncbi:MAG: OB-fold nucleic acid binding domain-containing protein [Planctomycetota bacterium]|nr:OB-fold nucleic acid binding domain-containing protein [Planctomycetota bacterium]MEC8510844.1 OB-fold nucleic acid binding domain-containing protein [Planctomycetota bacterium]